MSQRHKEENCLICVFNFLNHFLDNLKIEEIRSQRAINIFDSVQRISFEYVVKDAWCLLLCFTDKSVRVVVRFF